MPKKSKFYPQYKKMRGRDVESPGIGFYEKLMQESGKDSTLRAIIFTKDPEAYAKEAESKGIKVKFVHKLIDAVTIETTADNILAASDEGAVVKIWEDLKVQAL